MNKNRALSLWRSGFGPLTELTQEMDRLFTSRWDDNWDDVRGDVRSWSPACEVEEAKDHYLVTLEVPGIPKDQIKIEVVDHQLIVSGERRQEKKTTSAEGDSWYTERKFGRFQRSFALPQGVNAERVEADYSDGMLRLYVPKAESAKPRQIRIGERSPTGGGFFGKLLGQEKPEKAAS